MPVPKVAASKIQRRVKVQEYTYFALFESACYVYIYLKYKLVGSDSNWTHQDRLELLVVLLIFRWTNINQPPLQLCVQWRENERENRERGGGWGLYRFISNVNDKTLNNLLPPLMPGYTQSKVISKLKSSENLHGFLFRTLTFDTLILTGLICVCVVSVMMRVKKRGKR